MRRVAALVLLLALASACSSSDKGPLPGGSYAGSTAGQQALTIEVVGSTLMINGGKSSRGPDHSYIEKKPPHTKVVCSRAEDKQLSCLVTVGGRTETVLLLKL
jgi:hypothetical protein